jgi:ABC-type hemin transport system substrate-binding protein
MTDKEKLSESLTALRAEISQIDSVSSKQTLEALADQIEQHLASDNQSDEKRGLLESIDRSIDEFEVEHPDLTKSINRIMVMLSNMGI